MFICLFSIFSNSEKSSLSIISSFSYSKNKFKINKRIRNFKNIDPKIFLCRIRFNTPKGPSKYVTKSFFKKKPLRFDFKNPNSHYHSALPPSSADWIPSLAPAFSAWLFGPLAFFALVTGPLGDFSKLSLYM